ncbi:MAG TPA: hypothetical protein VIV40_08950 [Kofleriaceae bacterium]
MWARIHKLDRVRALPKGGALIVIEDGRSTAQMQRVPSLTTLIAIARVLAAKRAIEAKFDGKGEVRYATNAKLPSELSEAITKAGAAIADGSGDQILIPARASGVAALIDVAFSELAHHVRGSIGVVDIGAALRQLEAKRRATPLDRDAQPELYWPAVLELAALAGEQSRSLGGRWIDTRDLPVPFALKLGDGAIAHPTVVAQKIVEGGDALDMLSTAKPAAVQKPTPPTDEPLPTDEPPPAADKPTDEPPPTDKPPG